MKENVGRVDAMMRIAFGLTGVAWGTAKMMRRPDDSLPMLVTLAAAMKVAEGITRFCPLTAMFTADYDGIMKQAKDRLPIDKFTDQMQRRTNQMQEGFRNANETVQDTVRTSVETAQAGVRAVQNNVRGITRNTGNIDDTEPHH